MQLSLSSRRLPARPSRRDELLNSAAALFAERGFTGVTMDDIGRACGVSGPALYHHFAGKEAMLGEMLVSISEHLLAQAQRRVAAGADPRSVLSGLVADHAEFAVEHPELITVHFRDLVHAPEVDQRRVRRLQGRYVEQWVDVLTRQAQDLDPRAARAGVHAVLGLLNSTPFSVRLARDEMVAMLRRMAERSLGAIDPDE